VPDNLTPVLKANIEHHTMHPAHMVVDAVNEYVAFMGEKSSSFGYPLPSPSMPFVFAIILLPLAKILSEIVRRISNDQVER
jgi:hypothetical protein